MASPPPSASDSNGHFAVNIPRHHPDHTDDDDAPHRQDDDDELIDPDDPFDITQTKNASHDTLKRWRVIILFSSLLFNQCAYRVFLIFNRINCS